MKPKRAGCKSKKQKPQGGSSSFRLGVFAFVLFFLKTKKSIKFPSEGGLLK
ncbi:MAG: hypothetical protein M0Z61_15505 [Nitrospiraceae bacterium]|nr:hypothetical protein [Nitrospiraceae bacterium]